MNNFNLATVQANIRYAWIFSANKNVVDGKFTALGHSTERVLQFDLL